MAGPGDALGRPGRLRRDFPGRLIILMIIARSLSALVRDSVIGGLDRTLGLVFGLVRGAALVVIAYIIAGMVVQVDRWPDVVLEAHNRFGRSTKAPDGSLNRFRQNHRPQLYCCRLAAKRRPMRCCMPPRRGGHVTRE